MDPKLAALLKKVPLDKESVASVLPWLQRYGAQGAVLLARSYLGPVAVQVEQSKRCTANDPKQPRETAACETAACDGAVAAPAPEQSPGTGLKPTEVALLGMALTKLVYEAGELALHNPEVSAEGKQPEFALDANGSPPALSLAHVVAATRVWQKRSADAAQAAERAAPASSAAAPRQLLQTARVERYASAPRYAYVAPRSSRVPR